MSVADAQWAFVGGGHGNMPMKPRMNVRIGVLPIALGLRHYCTMAFAPRATRSRAQG
jgi:hypothetical protein